MTTRSPSRSLALLLATTVIGCAATVVVAPQAMAQSVAEARHDFAIPARPIRQTLNDIGRIAGIAVVFPETADASRSANAVQGNLTTAQAISAALQGSGLQWRFSNANTVTILAPEGADATAPAAPGSVVLDPVFVNGTAGVAGTGGVSVVGADAIARKQAGTLAEALNDVSGVHVARADDVLGSNITVRGFGGNSAQANDPRLAFNIDGASADGGSSYRNATNQIADPALLKSVRVYKGPLNSLEFGSNLVGGTVGMETIDGSDLTGGQIGYRLRQMVGGNTNGDGWVTSTTLAWQPAEDLDFLFNYTRRRQEQQKDGNGDAIGSSAGYNVPSYLFKANYRFGQNKEQRLSFSYVDSESAERNVPFSQMTVSSAFGLVDRDRAGQVASLTYGYKPAGNELIDLEAQLTASRQKFDLRGISGVALFFSGVYKVDTDTLTVKNTARFATGAIDHTLRAGIEVSRQERDEPMSGVAGAGKRKSSAIFALDEMQFQNDLTVTAGTRFERQKLYDLVDSSGIGVDDAGTTARTAGLGFEKGLGAGFSGYGSFTYGEGLATIDVASMTSTPLAKRMGTFVSKSRTYEAGVKFAGQDILAGGDTLTVSAGVYRTEIWDANTGTLVTAYPGFKTEGIEIEAAYAMDNGFHARSAVTVTDSKKSGLASGVATGWIDYEYTLANTVSLTLGKTFRNGFDVSWTARAGESLELNNIRRPGWGVHDISVRYVVQQGALEGLAIDFAVENVFDKRYVTQFATGTVETYPEAGRNVKLTLSKTF